MIATILSESDAAKPGQADGGTHGFEAVSSVIMNRVGQTNDALGTLQVLLAGQNSQNPNDRQFAGVGTARYNAAMDHINGGKLKGISASEFSRAARVAELHFTGKRTDTTNGATNFFSKRTPNWAKKMAQKSPEGYHGDNLFFGPQ